jgi:hypothetical protein
MKIGRIGAKISRFGGKLSKGSEQVFGKIEKGIKQGERIAVKGVGALEKVADSKVVTGVQQGLGIAGRALAATGIPQAQVAGAGLLAAQTGLKKGREAIKTKIAPEARGRIMGVSGQAQSKVLGASGKVQRTITGGVAKAQEVIGNANTLERAKPVMEEDNGVTYMS